MRELLKEERAETIAARSRVTSELSSPDIAAYFRGKTVLVTGAAGFIGKHLLRYLQALGAQVIALDREPGESLPAVRWVITDVLDLTQEHLEGISLDIAFHLAAIVGVSYTTQHPFQTLRVNVTGTTRFLKLVRALGAKVVCVVSSSMVYGEPDVNPITEDSNLNTLTIYGWSKLCAEQLLEAHVQGEDLCGIIIRPFNVYGPGQRNDFVISRFLQSAMRGLPLTVIGTGMQRRVFTFVDDLIYGMLLAVMKSKQGYQVYNIAGEGVISISELADLIISITKSDARPINVQLSDLERDPVGEVVMRIPSIEKARRELGYRPRTTLEQGLKTTFEQISLAPAG
jgi:nucleoside-diphosphate-sugar epimerase